VLWSGRELNQSFVCVSPSVDVLCSRHSDSCEEPEETEFGEGLKKRQMVFEFDMEAWKVCKGCPFDRISTDLVRAESNRAI
jgi:hypothetical protein